jgi:8-oxo-dGTP pyrophosphatase MutT (NUDIX family)
MPWGTSFNVDDTSKSITLIPSPDITDISEACTVALSRLIERAILDDTFKIIHGQHSEPYPIVGAKCSVSLERYAAPLFGIISRGAHLTAYTNTPDGLKIWVPRRSPHIFTYPDCLDTTVAGGVTAGEGPFECIVREAAEEASLDEELVRENTKAVGCISYVSHKDAPGGSEKGLISPELIYVFDLELPAGVICKQNDDEVKEFYLMGVEEVKEKMKRGEFKTNSACVMIDFFVRHGVITPEGERDFAEIVARLHRRLPLPTGPA